MTSVESLLLSISPNIPNFLGRLNFLGNIPHFPRFRIFYGVFTTPRNAILGSAVCRFSVDDMESSFEGNFKNQESLTSNWLPMSSNQVPLTHSLYHFDFLFDQNVKSFLSSRCQSLDQAVATTRARASRSRACTSSRTTA